MDREYGIVALMKIKSEYSISAKARIVYGEWLKEQCKKGVSLKGNPGWANAGGGVGSRLCHSLTSWVRIIVLNFTGKVFFSSISRVFTDPLN